MQNAKRWIAAAVALAAVALVAAGQWRRHSASVAADLEAAAPRALDAAAAAPAAPGRTPDASSPSEPPSAAMPAHVTDAAPEADLPRGAIPEEQDPRATVERIDPLLRERNVIARLGNATAPGVDFPTLESRFSSERTDPSWSDAMQVRILDQVAQVTGLALTTVDADCRETMCRVKLFYPPGADAFSSLDQLEPMAAALGFEHALEVATIGDAGVPIALLYFHSRR